MNHRQGLDRAQAERDRGEGPDPYVPYNDGYRNHSGYKGYEGFGPNAGEYVEIGDALDYALEHSGLKRAGKIPKEIAESIVECFYSGNWIPVIVSV